MTVLGEAFRSTSRYRMYCSRSRSFLGYDIVRHVSESASAAQEEPDSSHEGHEGRSRGGGISRNQIELVLELDFLPCRVGRVHAIARRFSCDLQYSRTRTSSSSSSIERQIKILA